MLPDPYFLFFLTFSTGGGATTMRALLVDELVEFFGDGNITMILFTICSI
jgi:hypothetical protein